jgi:hypothetical protein
MSVTSLLNSNATTPVNGLRESPIDDIDVSPSTEETAAVEAQGTETQPEADGFESGGLPGISEASINQLLGSAVPQAGGTDPLVPIPGGAGAGHEGGEAGGPTVGNPGVKAPNIDPQTLTDAEKENKKMLKLTQAWQRFSMFWDMQFKINEIMYQTMKKAIESLRV